MIRRILLILLRTPTEKYRVMTHFKETPLYTCTANTAVYCMCYTAKSSAKDADQNICI